MGQNKDPSGSEWRASVLQWALGGTCSIIIGLTGTLAGVWGGHMEKHIDEIHNGQRAVWTVLNERASLPPRIAELEKRTEDQEQRLREIERMTPQRKH